MSHLHAKVESLLFVAAKPLAVKKLCALCDASRVDVVEALRAIAARHASEESGIRVILHEDEAQMATSPDAAKPVREYLKDETTGELTKPSLETLTIIAYRGPVAKAEIEQIRGVNCSLILRNLVMRGLVESKGDPRDPQAVFTVSIEFLRHLGISRAADLPEYEKLRSHENVSRVLEMADPEIRH